MSAVFPISLIAGPGQPTPIAGNDQPAKPLAGPESGQDGESFAEMLTGALSGAAITAIGPQQQEPGKPLAGMEALLADIAPTGDASTLHPALSSGNASDAGHLSMPARQGQPSLESEAVMPRAAGQAGPLEGADGQTRMAELQRSPLGHRGADRADLDGSLPVRSPSIAAEAISAGHPLQMPKEQVPSGGPAIIDPAEGGELLPSRGTTVFGTDQVPDQSAFAFRSDIERVSPDVMQPVQGDPKGAGTRSSLLSLMKPMAGHEGSIQAASSGPSSAAPDVDQTSRSSHPAHPLSLSGQMGDAAQAGARAMAAGLEVGGDGLPLPQTPERQQAVRRSLDVSVKPIAASREGEQSQPASGLSARPPAMSDLSSGSRLMIRNSAIESGLPTAAPTAVGLDAVRSPTTEMAEGRQAGTQLAGEQPQIKPVAAGVLSDPGVLAANVDVDFRQTIDAGGVERFQSQWTVEGGVRDVERFDTLGSLASAKSAFPVQQPSAGAQIALQITRSAPDGVDRFSLQLHPAELGSVDVQLNFEGGGRLSALITAERPETLELLQRDSRFLERSLGDSGLKLTDGGLSFALKQDQQHQQSGHGQPFQEQTEGRQTASRSERGYDDVSDMEQTPSVRRTDGLRLLDIET